MPANATWRRLPAAGGSRRGLLPWSCGGTRRRFGGSRTRRESGPREALNGSGLARHDSNFADRCGARSLLAFERGWAQNVPHGGGADMAKLPTFAGLALSCLLAGHQALAQESYPSKPVRIVVSFAAGGPTDQVARIMGAKLTELLGQTFLVENKTGAGGNLGAADVAKAPPDGYTLLMATVSTHAINPGLYKKMPYDPVQDFSPVSQVGVTPCVLAVHPSIPVNDVKGLVALLKANPGKYSCGSSGMGSILHLCGEQFKTAAGGLQAVHVPYRGSAPMIADLMGGQLAFAFDAL